MLVLSIIVIRSIIIYFVVISAMRCMGKRQIGELQPSEFVVTMLISEVAASPIQNVNTPLLSGVLPVLTLLSFEVLLSFFALKSCRVRDFVTGRPSIVIHNGKIDQKEMEKLRLNMDDLVKELRLKSILDIRQVRYAILETNGQLSVIPQGNAQPPTLADLKIQPKEQALPFLLISGGKVNHRNLTMLGKDTDWMRQQLKQKKLRSPRQVLYMSCDEDGQVILIPRAQKEVSP